MSLARWWITHGPGSVAKAMATAYSRIRAAYPSASNVHLLLSTLRTRYSEREIDPATASRMVEECWGQPSEKGTFYLLRRAEHTLSAGILRFSPIAWQWGGRPAISTMPAAASKSGRTTRNQAPGSGPLRRVSLLSCYWPNATNARGLGTGPKRRRSTQNRVRQECFQTIPEGVVQTLIAKGVMSLARGAKIAQVSRELRLLRAAKT